jgi:hypothetical protein
VVVVVVVAAVVVVVGVVAKFDTLLLLLLLLFPPLLSLSRYPSKTETSEKMIPTTLSTTWFQYPYFFTNVNVK